MAGGSYTTSRIDSVFVIGSNTRSRFIVFLLTNEYDPAELVPFLTQNDIV
jgi:hypothetical protein